jgi:hypothetical protein
MIAIFKLLTASNLAIQSGSTARRALWLVRGPSTTMPQDIAYAEARLSKCEKPVRFSRAGDIPAPSSCLLVWARPTLLLGRPWPGLEGLQEEERRRIVCHTPIATVCLYCFTTEAVVDQPL